MISRSLLEPSDPFSVPEHLRDQVASFESRYNPPNPKSILDDNPDPTEESLYEWVETPPTPLWLASQWKWLPSPLFVVTCQAMDSRWIYSKIDCGWVGVWGVYSHVVPAWAVIIIPHYLPMSCLKWFVLQWKPRGLHPPSRPLHIWHLLGLPWQPKIEEVVFRLCNACSNFKTLAFRVDQNAQFQMPSLDSSQFSCHGDSCCEPNLVHTWYMGLGRGLVLTCSMRTIRD